jgi:hypothetical protein
LSFVPNGPDLSLTEVDAGFLLIAALEHGTHMTFWQSQAQKLLGKEAWLILDRCITGRMARPNQARNAIRLLAGEHSLLSMELLEGALKQPEWISFVLEELGKVPHENTLGMLKGALAAHPVRTELMAHISGDWTPAAKALLTEMGTVTMPYAENARGTGVSLATAEHNTNESGAVLSDPEWALMMRQIQSGRYLPVIGNTPRRRIWEEELARRHLYPDGLARGFNHVAQYVEKLADRSYLISFLKGYEDTEAPKAYYRSMALLPLPIYVTAEFGLGIERALRNEGRRPRPVACSWRQRQLLARSSHSPYSLYSADEPLVFHMSGMLEEPESLVLTVDDQTEFLATISEERDRIPGHVRAALSVGSAVFLNYRGDELDFSVFRRIVAAHIRIGAYRNFLSPPKEFLSADASRYLRRYLGGQNIDILSESPGEFTAELARRWEKFRNDGSTTGQ